MAQAFCSACGAGVAAAAFCPQCGTATANRSATDVIDLRGQAVEARAATSAAGGAPVTASPQPSPTVPVQPTAPIPTFAQTPSAVTAPPVAMSELSIDAGRRDPNRARWLALGAGAVVLLLIAATAAIALARSNADSSASTTYVNQVRAAIDPVVASNTSLNASLAALTAGNSTTAAQTQVASTTALAESARTTLTTLPAEPSNAPVAAQAKSAVNAELAWLATVSLALTKPSSPQVAQIQALGTTAQNAFSALATTVPSASAAFPDSTAVVNYAAATRARSDTRTAERAFVKQVDGLLRQSKPSYDEINRLFNEFSGIASGGYSSLTIPQAEQTLSSVVASRTALQASAQSLDAPSGQARVVRAALVNAFAKSLKNDEDIYDCLNLANTGSFAIIFQSCLDSTASGASAATAAKNEFRREFNVLRKRVGLDPTNRAF